MPGRTPWDALRAFLGPLESALSCVARAKITTSPNHSAPDKIHAWTINSGEGAILKTGGQPLLLKASMQFMVIRTDEGAEMPWRVTTCGYMYSLSAQGQEVWAWHWHPSGNSRRTRPHQHVGAAVVREDGLVSPRKHMPDDRASFERVVRTAIEVGVVPLRDDYDEVLLLSEGPFEIYRSWGLSPPEA